MSRSQPIIALHLVMALCLPATAQQQIITGKVIAVNGGDTITVRDADRGQHVISLAGIDAPESNQAFGDKARQSLSDLVFGKTVTVTGSKSDRYEQIVGKVTLGRKDINLEQIRRGFAWFYRKYANELSKDEAKAYEQAEAEARDKGRGLWAGPGPIPPWELRAAQHSDPSVGNVQALAPEPSNGKVIGNRNSMIYYRPDCPDYAKAPERNRVLFKTEAEAVAAGYRKARNCP